MKIFVVQPFLLFVKSEQLCLAIAAFRVFLIYAEIVGNKGEKAYLCPAIRCRGNEMFPLFFTMNEKVLTSVRDWLDEKFETEETFHDCYLVDLTLAGNKLAVFVDADEGLSLKKCQQISRFLEERSRPGT